MIYLDNAATSWPKPESVTQAMVHFMENVGANPGRSGHRLSVEAGRVVNEAREQVAALFGVRDPFRVAFGINATAGLNLGIRGLLKKGDHVITSSMEHNSVMRPLRDLEGEGVELTVVPCSKEGFMDVSHAAEAFRKNTKLLVVNQGSNIVGSLLSVRELGKLAHENDAYLLVDTAQTAGCLPINMKEDNIDLLAFTGHKGLLGPQGTGGLVLADSFDYQELRRLWAGGSGSRSELEEHPNFLPDKYESGTLNTVGLAGLAAGVSFVREQGVERIHQKEQTLTTRFLNGARDIQGLKLYGGLDPKRQTPTISINIHGLSPSEAGLILDEEFDIMCRVGLHCAPTAHRTIGSFPGGTVRLGMGFFTTEEEVDTTLEALTIMADEA